MISFQWPIKFKKRQVSALGAPSEWIPFSNNFPPTQATRLATVGRCLRLYSDFLLQTTLEPQDHYLTKLLNKPNRWQSKKNFYESLTFELLLNGNFHAKVDYDSTGKVTALLPFRVGQIYCHPTNGEYSDPVALQRGGYYYKDFKGRVFMPDDIFHLRDAMFNTSDQLNGLSRIYLYEILFQSGYSVQAVQKVLSDSGLRPPWLLSGLPEEDSSNTKSVRDTIEKFFKQTEKQVLTVPEGFDLKQLMLNNPENVLEFLASKSDLDIARIFSVPIELIGRADAEGEGGAQHIKESHRFFIKNSLTSFFKNISDGFENLAMDGTQFSFEVDRFRASDLREQSQYISQLVTSEVLSPKEAKAMI